MPLAPQWGVKKSSEGKNVFWYGYKGHLVAGKNIQYVLSALLSSGNFYDGKAAIPLMKGVTAQFKRFSLKYATMGAGYDYEPI